MGAVGTTASAEARRLEPPLGVVCPEGTRLAVEPLVILALLLAVRRAVRGVAPPLALTADGAVAVSRAVAVVTLILLVATAILVGGGGSVSVETAVLLPLASTSARPLTLVPSVVLVVPGVVPGLLGGIVVRASEGVPTPPDRAAPRVSGLRPTVPGAEIIVTVSVTRPTREVH